MSDDGRGLPPLGLLLFFLIGAFVMFQAMDGFDLTALIGLIFLGGAVGMTGYIYYNVKNEGVKDTVNWLLGSKQDTGGGNSDSSSKVPPPSENLKNELYFERADQKCEWCEEHTDYPEVHHIKPRAEGGSNDTSNLIVLCRNCHGKADRNAISRNKLNYKVKKQMEDY
ncbi:Restriction endonuclease HNH family [Methanonatronarchaeum thermophilum]|uniref:Restriction endonuclease HNH family n=1 Tax=Methanonatronarchaeum thermophilum TaxID=1927129 RepID=A0A1Y3GHM4_9EURY|nr:HNH endonuclease signature motif containing protein [Methanonatronarchaeum thermophilum]OUJ18886.1 Restriction endonuclease HNH family [Methanonatronarchaeum thermophilum]